jgi:hypothetical protein
MELQESKKYIYGDLNTEIRKTNYSGKKTDSLEIHVDNEAGTISGNVLWDAMLGESIHTAYPGHLGKLNEQKIIELADSLAKEIDRVSTIDWKLENEIKCEGATRKREIEGISKKLDDALKTLKVSLANYDKLINEERARAINEEKILADNLAKETDSIHKSISSLNKDISDEVNRATASEQTINSRIDKEISNVNSIITKEVDKSVSQLSLVDNDIRKSLSDEIINREQSENEIRSSLDTTNNRLKDEVERATQEEGRLSELFESTTEEFSQQLSILSSNMESMQTTVNNAVSAEANRAKEAEASLSAQDEFLNNLIIDTDNALRDDIQQKVQTLNDEDSRLQEAIDNESSDRKALGEELLSKIEKEKSRAILAENALSDLIESKIADASGNTSDITKKLSEDIEDTQQELSNLTDKIDNELTPHIEAKILALEASDESLRETITNETKRATEEEKTLLQTISDGLSHEAVCRNKDIGDILLKTQEISDTLSNAIAESTDRDSSLTAADEALLAEITELYNQLSIDNQRLDRLDYDGHQTDNEIRQINESLDAIRALIQSNKDERVDSDKQLMETISNEITRSTEFDQQFLDKMLEEHELFSTGIDNLREYTAEELHYLKTNVEALSNALTDESNIREQSVQSLEDTLTSSVEQLQQKDDAIVKLFNFKIDKLSDTDDLLRNDISELGSQLNDEVQNLTNKIDTEISNLDSKLSEDLLTLGNDLTTKMIESDNKISLELVSLGNKLEDEASELNTKIATVSNELNQKINSEISGVVTTLNNSVSELTNRDDQIESELNSRLDDVSDTLSNAITSEIARAESSEASLYESIDANRDMLDSEIARAKSVEETLQTTITDVNQDLTDEIARATLVEESLQHSITNISNVIEDSYVKSVFDGSSGNTKVYAVRDNTNIVCGVSDVNVADTLVMRNGDGHIVIQEDIEDETYALNEAVPKIYIDKLVEDIKSELSKEIAAIYSINMIRAGNAPIEE